MMLMTDKIKLHRAREAVKEARATFMYYDVYLSRLMLYPRVLTQWIENAESLRPMFSTLIRIVEEKTTELNLTQSKETELLDRFYLDLAYTIDTVRMSAIPGGTRESFRDIAMKVITDEFDKNEDKNIIAYLTDITQMIIVMNPVAYRMSHHLREQGDAE